MTFRAVGAAVACAAAVLAGPGAASAATIDVSISGFAYSPDTTTIDPGDVVTWHNLDGVNHDVVSTTGLFASPMLPQGGSYARTFAQPGTFDYLCSLHPSMRGKVVVRGEASPPTLPPDNVRARPGDAVGEVELTWTPPIFDGGSPVTGYRVCRTGAAPSCTVTPATSFSDANRPLLETQSYTVSAINSFGEGPASAPVCAKPFPWHERLGC